MSLKAKTCIWEPWFDLKSEIYNFYIYLSNRPQVSMVYRLINQAGCWKYTRRIRKSRAAGNCYSNIPSNNSEDARIFHGFTGTINHSRLTNQSSRIDLEIAESAKSEPFNPKYPKFREESQMEQKSPVRTALLFWNSEKVVSSLGPLYTTPGSFLARLYFV